MHGRVFSVAAGSLWRPVACIRQRKTGMEHIDDHPVVSVRAEMRLLQLLCEGHNPKYQVP